MFITVRSRSPDHFCIASRYIKIDKTSWTDSIMYVIATHEPYPNFFRPKIYLTKNITIPSVANSQLSNSNNPDQKLDKLFVFVFASEIL